MELKNELQKLKKRTLKKLFFFWALRFEEPPRPLSKKKNSRDEEMR